MGQIHHIARQGTISFVAEYQKMRFCRSPKMLEKFGNLGKSSNMMHIWPWISQKGDLLSLLKSSLAQALTEPTPKAQKRRPSKLKFPKKMPEMDKKCPKNMSYMLFSVIYGS